MSGAIIRMELREVTTRHSPYGDGLSFGQNSSIGLNYTNSNFPGIQRFSTSLKITLGFSGIEETIRGARRIQFHHHDMSPVSVFYYVAKAATAALASRSAGSGARSGMGSAP